MHNLEPFYNWRTYYQPERDAASPFTELLPQDGMNRVYNYVLHPNWERFGSPTLYTKVLFADYHAGFIVMEMIGEWNDCINNDIMYFKRDVIEPLMREGISKFILIGENVLNFHGDTDTDYYDEWFEEVQEEEGWISMVNFRDHVLDEMDDADLQRFIHLRKSDLPWRTFNPIQFCKMMHEAVSRQLAL